MHLFIFHDKYKVSSIVTMHITKQQQQKQKQKQKKYVKTMTFQLHELTHAYRNVSKRSSNS